MFSIDRSQESKCLEITPLGDLLPDAHSWSEMDENLSEVWQSPKDSETGLHSLLET